MITLNQKQKIIIAYHNRQKSQRAIARELGLNRRTVARYIKDYYRKRTQLLADRDNLAKEELAADIIQAPSYDASSRKKVKMTTEKEGFNIGYTSICNLIRKIQRESQEAYIRQEYAPGEVCEFDWGEVRLTIAGKSRIFHMAVFSSTWSDYRYGELYASQKTESFLDSYVSFFSEIGGVYQEMVYDNARVMVARFVGHSEKEPTGPY